MAEEHLVTQAAVPDRIEFLKPEASLALQRILHLARSEDWFDRIMSVALFNKNFGSPEALHAGQRHVNTVSYLCERGVLNPIGDNLNSAFTEGWIVLLRVEESSEKNGASTIRPTKMIEKGTRFLNRIEECTQALEFLAVDCRTVRFILKTIPGLAWTLKAIFLTEPSDARIYLRFTRPQDDARMGVLRAICRMFPFSETFRKELLSPDFLHAVLEHSLNNFQYSKLLQDSICLLHNLSNAYPALHVEVDVLPFSARVLAESEDVGHIHWAFQLLLAALQPYGPETPKKMEGVPFLQSALLALATCKKAGERLQTYARGLSGVLKGMAYFLEKSDPRLRNENRQYDFGMQFHSWDAEANSACIRKLARKDTRARVRAQQLSRIFSDPLNAEHASYKIISGKKNAAASVSEKKREEKTGFKIDERMARRKCARTGCGNVEQRPAEFKVCSGCKLAVYCSRGKLINSTPHLPSN